MVYTPEERQQIDQLFLAFSDYIRSHSYFDIVWSEKFGYLRIVPDDAGDDVVLRIGSFPEAARMLFWDFFSDAEGAWPEPVDPDAVQNRICPFLRQLQEPERGRCEAILRQLALQWSTENSL